LTALSLLIASSPQAAEPQNIMGAIMTVSGWRTKVGVQTQSWLFFETK